LTSGKHTTVSPAAAACAPSTSGRLSNSKQQPPGTAGAGVCSPPSTSGSAGHLGASSSSQRRTAVAVPQSQSAPPGHYSSVKPGTAPTAGVGDGRGRAQLAAQVSQAAKAAQVQHTRQQKALGIKGLPPLLPQPVKTR
jgi:hypothetical protein